MNKNIIYVKLRQLEKNKYRKLVSTDEIIYENIKTMITSSIKYTPGSVLEDGEWFYIEDANNQSYTKNIQEILCNSVDFDSFEKNEFKKIDFLFIFHNNNIYFQNISKAKLIAKRLITFCGEDFRYSSEQQEIVINDLPDAIYESTSNRLYFRKLETITRIFKGIDQLYREATNEEVDTFLKNDFITLQNDYSVSSVKTANRKRIALAKKTLDLLNDTEQKQIFSYIGEYCPNLKTENNTFKIGTEEEMKMLLFGIEQRFYTTPVGNEKRLANSIIQL